MDNSWVVLLRYTGKVNLHYNVCMIRSTEENTRDDICKQIEARAKKYGFNGEWDSFKSKYTFENGSYHIRSYLEHSSEERLFDMIGLQELL